MDFYRRLVLNENTIFATDSKPLQNSGWQDRYLIILLKLSGLGGIRARIDRSNQTHIGKFQRQSQRSSRYTVRTWYKCSLLSSFKESPVTYHPFNKFVIIVN